MKSKNLLISMAVVVYSQCEENLKCVGKNVNTVTTNMFKLTTTLTSYVNVISEVALQFLTTFLVSITI